MNTGLFALGQIRRDALAEGAARSAQGKADQAERSAAEIADRLDRLTLVCLAMWELLRERTNLHEDDLLAKVQEIDLRDGVPDGKVTATVQKCGQCRRTMSPRHRRCLYCGHESLVSSAFDGVA